MPLFELLKVAGLVFAAMTSVVVGDTAGKLLTGAGVAPAFVAWTRFAVAALILLPLSGLTVSEVRYLKDWRVLARGVLIAGGIFCILSALRTEPIADAFGAFFIGPIVSYVLAIVFLGERPSFARTLLLGTGFIGVMLVVKPGYGGSVGILFALAAGCFYGAFLVMTRTVASDYRPRFLLISQLMVGTVILAPFGLSVELPDLSASVTALILLSAAGSAFGSYLLVVANKMAEASLIAPLVYTQLISATVLGILVFGEWPDSLSFAGLALIAASGFGSLLLQRPKVVP